MVEDNWQNRNGRMKCTSCVFFVEKGNNGVAIAAMIGRCRKRAPTLNGWPVMFSTDWCGDHKLDETKITHFGDENK